jgi:hypothetical protein
VAGQHIRQQRRFQRLAELQQLGVLWDEEDYDKLSQYLWRVHPVYNYLVATPEFVGEPATVMMHHITLGRPPTGQVVDHINRNVLDNRKSNLRFATLSQNAVNSKRVDVAECIYQTHVGYEVTVQRDGIRLHRHYSTENEAVAAIEAFLFACNHIKG